jgi:uncharacterized protein (DUF885 family)
MRLFKKMMKWFGLTLAVVLVLGGAFAAHSWYFKPVNINIFFARAFFKVALESPEMLSSLHVLEQFGINGHNAELDDESIESGTRLFDHMKNSREILLSYEDEDLAEGNVMSKRIALNLMDMMIELEPYRFHNYPLNQMFGAQSNFPSFMESTHQVHSVGDAEDYVTRMSQSGRKFDQVLDGLKRRENLGILPPQFVITKVLEEMRNFVDTPAEEGILMVSLTDKMKEADLPEDDQQRIALAARTEIENTVYPAYDKLIDYFAALDDKVNENKGVWALPDGDNFYRLAMRLFTTTDYTPEYIHNFGLSEVHRIQAEILGILEGEGWDVSEGFHAAISEMADDPKFYYSDSGEGRDQILADYQIILDEISEGLEPYFDVLPESELEVKRIAEFKEKTSPGAYYERPAMDGSRPGIFYANLYDIKATPRYGMRTLAYHEGVPGHHFQLAIQQQQEDLPFFRRIIPAVA